MEYISQEGYDKLKKELEFLKTTKRREIADALEKARSFGDLSENAEYDAAKEAQALNEKKIAELENRIAHLIVVDESQMPNDKAVLGVRVHLQDLETGEELEYKLVSDLEADPLNGLISVKSPVGQGLLGHEVGDIIEITVPAGKIKYKIIGLSR